VLCIYNKYQMYWQKTTWEENIYMPTVLLKTQYPSINF
jgi:hypothetical protein